MWPPIFGQPLLTAQMGYGRDLKFGMDSWVEDRRITKAIFEFSFLNRAMAMGGKPFSLISGRNGGFSTIARPRGGNSKIASVILLTAIQQSMSGSGSVVLEKKGIKPVEPASSKYRVFHS